MNKIFENEQLFAAANKRLMAEAKKIAPNELPDDFVMDLYCECMNKRCLDRLSVELGIYTSQKNTLTYFVRPLHFLPEYERLIQKTPDYFIIQKRPEKLGKPFEV